MALPKGYGIIEGEQTFETESYVHVPPALYIVDKEGNIWGLGFRKTFEHDSNYYYWNVLKGKVGVNAPPKETGEYADHIEYTGRDVRIHTATGWKVWSGNQFV